MIIKIKELHVHESGRVDEMKLLKRLELLIGKVMTTVNELAAQLNLVNEQLNKAKVEIISQVQALEDALRNGNIELPQEAQDALNAVVATAKALDDLNPDQEPAPAE